MNLISPILGGSQNAPPAQAGPKDKSPKGAEETNGQGNETSNTSGQNATEPTAEVGQSLSPTSAGQGAAAPVADEKAVSADRSSTALSASEDKRAEDANRQAAENRIEQARTRAMIDSIAPVASSAAQGSKSYMETLLTSKPATEPAAADVAPDAPADAAA